MPVTTSNQNGGWLNEGQTTTSLGEIVKSETSIFKSNFIDTSTVTFVDSSEKYSMLQKLRNKPIHHKSIPQTKPTKLALSLLDPGWVGTTQELNTTGVRAD